MNPSTRVASDTRIHVVHVIGSLQTGGAEKMLLNFLKAADKEKFKHTILCLTSSGDMAGDIQGTGIDLVVRKVRFRNFPKDIHGLADWFRAEDVRIVHSHMFFASLWSRIAGLRAGVPILITTEHGKEPWKKWWQVKLDRFLSGKTFRHIAVSEDVRDIRINRDGVSPDRIIMIPNGVPIPPKNSDSGVRNRIRAEFGIEERAPVVGTVGRMIEAKDYPLMLKALGLARQASPELHWLQVGDGPEREKVMNLAEEMGLSASVSFAGRRSDVGDLLEAMDIWVMSSIREGLPVALLEAMAAGKTIVGTNVGGIPDAVEHEVSALLVPPQNAEELAGSMVMVLNERSLAENLATAARDRAQRDFGIEAVTRRIEKIYLEGLSARLP